MTSVIDTPWNIATHVPTLKAAGVKTVFRYINIANSTHLPEKCVTVAEAKALASGGLSLGLVFEQNQDHAGAFSAAIGTQAAQRVLQLSGPLGIPAGRPIYFAADFDPRDEPTLALIDAFFAAAKQVFATHPGQFQLGVYSSGLVCTRLLDKGLATFAWVTNSASFAGRAQFLASGRWHLEQKLPPNPTDLAVAYDPNLTNPAKPDHGAFIPTPP